MTMWHERWAQEKTGWDLNGPHPLTRILLQRVAAIAPQMLTGRWLIPGCGRAHDGPFLLESGASFVEGRDIVPRAIEEAKRLYHGVPNFSLRCEDITNIGAADVATFDCIFDRAMLCALEGENRRQYVRSCSMFLKPGGFFASLAFARTDQPEIGPPFQIMESEVRGLFANEWRLECLEERKDGACGEKILSEWILIARKL